MDKVKKMCLIVSEGGEVGGRYESDGGRCSLMTGDCKSGRRAFRHYQWNNAPPIKAQVNCGKLRPHNIYSIIGIKMTDI